MNERFCNQFPIPRLPFFHRGYLSSTSISSHTKLYRQLEPTRDLSLENAARVIPLRRLLQARNILPSIRRYRVLGLVRIIQVHKIMQQSHISGRFVCLPHDILRRLLYDSVGGCGAPEGTKKENYKVPIVSASRFLHTGWLNLAGRARNGYSLTPLPSAGVVPSELAPFDWPSFVTCAGSGSNAKLQSIPPGTWVWLE